MAKEKTILEDIKIHAENNGISHEFDISQIILWHLISIKTI